MAQFLPRSPRSRPSGRPSFNSTASPVTLCTPSLNRGCDSTFSEEWYQDAAPIQATLSRDGFSDEWPMHRRIMGRAFSSTAFDVTLCFVVIANMVLLVADTDHQASHESSAEWARLGTYIFLVFYGIELSLRIYVYRYSFFTSFSNWADFLIVLTDVAVESVILALDDQEAAAPIVVFRIFRLLRLGRTHRALVLFPELNVMVRGLAGAFRAMFWGMILLLLSLTTWGILAVQIIHPLTQDISCEECSDAFKSVTKSMLTFTRHIIAGDSWGTVSVPIIQHYPITYLFFFGVLVSLGMAILNLILAVVIDSAALARRDTDCEIARNKEARYRCLSKELLEVCAQFDKDGNGSLSFKELMNGYRAHAGFRDKMTVLDISEQDMKTVFKILDEDCSGDINYEEFVHQLYKMKSDDSHTLLVFIRYYITEVRQKINQEMSMIKNLIHSERKHFRELRTMTTKPDGAQQRESTPLPEVDLQKLRECSRELADLLNCSANFTPGDGPIPYYSSLPSQHSLEQSVSFQTSAGATSVDQWLSAISEGARARSLLQSASCLTEDIVSKGQDAHAELNERFISAI